MKVSPSDDSAQAQVHFLKTRSSGVFRNTYDAGDFGIPLIATKSDDCIDRFGLH